MALELYYTSAPKGLRPGSSGFCTVALTRSMPAPLIAQLEALSAYRPLYAVGSANENRNPVSRAHYRVNIGGRMFSILSQVRFAGTDYSHRSNKFAHHVALEPEELAPGGPAWMLRQNGVLDDAWDEPPRKIEEPRRMPYGDRPAAVCERWEAVTGDAGWAGVLAERFVLDATKPVYVLYEVGQDVLGLFEEVVALLPPEARWRATFNTYLSQLPSGVACAWRGCVMGTRAAREAVSANGALLIDLTRPLGAPHESKYVTLARTGEMIVLPPSAVAMAEPSVEFEADDEPLKVAPLEDKPREPTHRPVYIPTTPTRAPQPASGIPAWFWLVALAWPVLVLGLGLVFYSQQSRATQKAEDRAREAERRLVELEDDLAGFESERTALQERVEALQSELKQLHAALDQPPKARPTPPSNPGRRETRSRHRPPPPRAKVTRTTPAAPRRFDNVDRVQREPASAADRQPLARPLPNFAGHWFADLPELVHPSRGVTRRSVALLDNLSASDLVELALPEPRRGHRPGAQPADFAVETRTDGSSILLRLSADRWAELSSLHTGEGMLWWDWKVPGSVMGQTMALRRLDRLVRHAAVLVTRGETTAAERIQFVRPQTAEIVLQDQTGEVHLIGPPVPIDLEVLRYPLGWTTSATTRPGGLQLTSSQGLKLEFGVDRAAEHTAVSAHWPAGRPDKQLAMAKSEYAQARFDWDTTRTRREGQLARIQDELDDIRVSLDRAEDEPERERLRSRRQKAYDRRERIENALQVEQAAFERATASFDAVQAQLDDYAAMTPIEIACRHAQTEVVLAVVEVHTTATRQRPSTGRSR